MAITNLAAYQGMIAAPQQRATQVKNNVTTLSGRVYSLFAVGGESPTGTVPTTPVACDSTLAGAFPFRNSTAVKRLVKIAGTFLFSGVLPGGMLMIVDRLSHMGGLSGIATGAQTTNLPTAALTRYTNGVGVMAAMEIYTAIGTGGATAVCEYTNSAGTGGRVTPAFQWGIAGNSSPYRATTLPLQDDDVGIRSVESFTASGSSGAAGNFGVTLYAPLACMPLDGNDTEDAESIWNLGFNFAEVKNDACLTAMLTAPSTATGAAFFELMIAEEL